jgi:chromosome segregation protein
MQLTHLEIHGFKSFAEKTRLGFDRGITGIVGPNGCGKSNVIDAIRWVLGEQKTRNLRSDKMENVIFNGTDKRKRGSIAEVSLTLENTRNILPTEYTHVTITRRLYRDGESEYLLNNVPCRLKDINNLFMDTGIGPDTYAIIELGQVEEILNDKNNSRRQLFEEAAGISKYKVRKKETFARLEESEQSLTRVEDLLFEIEKNLKLLEKQAKRAEKYYEIKSKYRKASSQVALLKLKVLENDHRTLLQQEKECANRLAELQARIAQADAHLQELQKNLVVEEESLQQAQLAYNQHLEVIQKHESDNALRNERMKFQLQRQATLEEAATHEIEQRDAYTKRLAELDRQIAAAQQTEATQSARLQTLVQQTDAAKAALNEQNQRVSDANSALKGAETRLSAQQREVERRLIQIQGLQNELERSRTEARNRQDDVTQLSETTAKLRTSAATLENEYNQLAALKAEKDAAMVEVQKKIEILKEEIYQQQRTLDQKEQEYNLTRGLVESLEGYSESVKFLRKSPGWAVETPLLSDIFYIPENVKVATEWLLEPFMSYYVVANRQEAVAGLRLLKNSNKGRAHFFMLDEIAQWMAEYKTRQEQIFNLPLSMRPLIELLEFNDKYRPLAQFLLRDVYVVNGEIPTDVVVPEGVTLIDQQGTTTLRRNHMSGGSVGLFEGKRIGRAKDLEKLEPLIAELRQALDLKKQTLHNLQTELRTLQSVNYAQKLDYLQKEVQLAQRQLAMQQVKEEEYLNFISRLNTRGVDLENEIQRIKADDEAAMPALREIQAEVAQLQAQLASQQEELQRRADALNERQQEYNNENLQLVTLRNATEGLRKDVQFQREGLDNLENVSRQRKDELFTLKDELAKLARETQDENDTILGLYNRKMELDAVLNENMERVREHKAQVLQREDEVRHERNQRDEVSAEYNGLKDKATEVRMQENSLKERMSVEFGLDIVQVVPDQVFDKPTEEYNLDDVEQDMLHLRDQLHKFGEINPTAIEAYKEVEERYKFILQQREDLLNAKQNLLTTLQELDTTAREKFMESFNAIRENFIRVFRSLFTDQDTCDLILQNPDEPLESAIEIMAKPKGKRPLTINQLSGGEKTLTAISLLFAVYLLKPAPFCIFDEVDAPLDDANIDKFTNIITDFSNESQFIVVTHNKRTMAKTQVMYGVTMEETGVSRVLPVDFRTLNLN